MTHEKLRTLLTDLADDMSDVPQQEYSVPAWSRARAVRRRRMAWGLAAAVILIAVPVAFFAPGGRAPLPPGDQSPIYSATPLRGRAAASATLLTDGWVLITGGCATDGCTTAEGTPNTEYFVPGRGFTKGPEPVQPRQGHGAIRLADGRVLILGGWSREGTQPLAQAEVYDPRTRRFAAVGNLNQGRGGATVTELPDGRILVAGGQLGTRTVTESTEIFDPVSNSFTAAAPMPVARDAAVAIALPDGRVLVAGGENTNGALASAVLYDPVTNTWQDTGSLATPRSKPAIAPLPDGRVLVLGGTPDDRELLRTTEIYDPASGLFTPGPLMDIGRYKFTVAVDARGRVIAAGGMQAAVYNPAQVGPGAGQFHPIVGTMGRVRWTATVTGLSDGAVLIVGGYGGQIELLDDAVVAGPGQIDAAATAIPA